jgi:hypothetical protein
MIRTGILWPPWMLPAVPLPILHTAVGRPVPVTESTCAGEMNNRCLLDLTGACGGTRQSAVQFRGVYSVGIANSGATVPHPAAAPPSTLECARGYATYSSVASEHSHSAQGTSACQLSVSSVCDGISVRGPGDRGGRLARSRGRRSPLGARLNALSAMRFVSYSCIRYTVYSCVATLSRTARSPRRPGVVPYKVFAIPRWSSVEVGRWDRHRRSGSAGGAGAGAWRPVAASRRQRVVHPAARRPGRRTAAP